MHSMSSSRAGTYLLSCRVALEDALELEALRPEHALRAARRTLNLVDDLLLRGAVRREAAVNLRVGQRHGLSQRPQRAALGDDIQGPDTTAGVLPDSMDPP